MAMMAVISCVLLLIFAVLPGGSTTLKDTSGFSGVYTPKGRRGMHHYAGACLVGTKRLIEATGLIQNATRLEDVGFSLCG